MADWSNQTSSTNDFCDEIDEIMKHEHEDVILLDDSLSATPLDLDLDSISDLLENPPSSSTSSSFSQPLNITDLPSTFTINNNNNSQSNTTTTSAYSSLGISPKFTTLSINNNPFQQFLQSNNLHVLPYIQPQQQDNTILGRSYPFELQSNTNGPSDVKRFRSASMNDGPSSQQQQTKLGIFLTLEFSTKKMDWKSSDRNVPGMKNLQTTGDSFSCRRGLYLLKFSFPKRSIRSQNATNLADDYFCRKLFAL